MVINDKIMVSRIIAEITINMIRYDRVWRCVLVIF